MSPSSRPLPCIPCSASYPTSFFRAPNKPCQTLHPPHYCPNGVVATTAAAVAAALAAAAPAGCPPAAAAGCSAAATASALAAACGTSAASRLRTQATTWLRASGRCLVACGAAAGSARGTNRGTGLKSYCHGLSYSDNNAVLGRSRPFCHLRDSAGLGRILYGSAGGR